MSEMNLQKALDDVKEQESKRQDRGWGVVVLGPEQIGLLCGEIEKLRGEVKAMEDDANQTIELIREERDEGRSNLFMDGMYDGAGFVLRALKVERGEAG